MHEIKRELGWEKKAKRAYFSVIILKALKNIYESKIKKRA
jgi:hypothetical protein